MIRVLILCLFANFQTVKPNRISSKLDFGQDDHPVINIKSPGVISSNIKDETTVICSGSGCNKTTTENSDKDIVNDVVVHVKTSVNIPKTKNETIDDTPDVPIFLGYGNSQFTPKDPPPIREPKPHYRKYHVPSRNKQVSFENDVMYVTYFEPSFHGEQPPLQYVWPAQDGAVGFNPVEFKRFEKPTAWNRPVGGSFPPQVPAGSNGYYTTCTCRNPGLNWYPTTPMWNINRRGNLNAGIDDKLAPLN